LLTNFAPNAVAAVTVPEPAEPAAVYVNAVVVVTVQVKVPFIEVPAAPVMPAMMTSAPLVRPCALAIVTVTVEPVLLALLIVPRHVERRAEITAALKTIGLAPALRSVFGSHVDSNAPVFVIDTTGELAAWQHLATLVVVGKRN
jgi:hypothetical protein